MDTISRENRTMFAAVLVAATLAVSSPAAANAAAAAHAFSFAQQQVAQTIVHRATRIVVGSGAATTRAMQRRTGPLVTDWPTGGGLFAADPSLNGVLVYDETATGNTVLPYGILSGPNTQINAPVAVATGLDVPCQNNICTSYLWVSNAGNNTITSYRLPLTNWNEQPTEVVAWNGGPTCLASAQSSGPGLGAPYGIVHIAPTTPFQPGIVIDASEANVNGSYYLVGWPAYGGTTSNACITANTSVQYDSASGPSVDASTQPLEIFNANARTVTETPYTQPASWGLANSWMVGKGACTEGTAVQQRANGGGYVWVTSNQGCNFPAGDSLWRCKISQFPNHCPQTPVCQNVPGNGPSYLDFPDYPAISPHTNRIYVPNQNNGTLTSYTLGQCTPAAIYLNAQTPFGVAVQQ